MNSLSTLSRQQQKIVEAASAIATTPPGASEKMFLARQLVQATLPHSDPGNVPVWSRRYGDVVLTIQQGYDDDGKPLGHPFGAIPRLLMYWMTTEAVRSKQRKLDLGKSLSDFVREVGYNPRTGGGPRGDLTRVRTQLNSLVSATIRFSGRMKDDSKNLEGSVHRPMQVAEQTVFWWSAGDDDAHWRSGSHIVLDEQFFQAITASAVPVDLRALRAIKRSPLALDLYSLLAYHSFLAQKSGRPRLISWRDLENALGASYEDSENFRTKVSGALLKIELVYPRLRLGSRCNRGIEILPESFPAVGRCG